MIDLYDQLTGEIHTNKAQKGNGRVFFIRHLDAIQRCLADGYSKRRVWLKLRQMEQMPVSYEQFLKHCKTLLGGDTQPHRSAPAAAPMTPRAPQPAAPAAAPPPTDTPTPDQEKTPRQFDPASVGTGFTRNRHALPRETLRGPQ